MKKYAIVLLLALALCMPQVLRAQVKDSVVHSPTKAWLMSAAFPGLGQMYNQRYWKLPIIYGGFAAFGYFIQSNNFRYNLYGDAYDAKYAISQLNSNDPNYESELARLQSEIPSVLTHVQEDRLLYYRNQYRRNRDFFIILTALFYVINMVDAAVDAHFYSYDISNDLSLNWQPFVEPYHASFNPRPVVGVNFSIRF